jgi:hypothetical protein
MRTPAKLAQICRKPQLARLYGLGNSGPHSRRPGCDFVGEPRVASLYAGCGHRGEGMCDGHCDRGLVRPRSLPPPPEDRTSGCHDNGGDRRRPRQRESTASPSSLRLAPIGLRAPEASQIALEGPKIFELGAAFLAGVQVSPAVFQRGRRQPAFQVSFQVLMGQMSDRFFNTAGLSGQVGVQSRIHVRRIRQVLAARRTPAKNTHPPAAAPRALRAYLASGQSPRLKDDPTLRISLPSPSRMLRVPQDVCARIFAS